MANSLGNGSLGRSKKKFDHVNGEYRIKPEAKPSAPDYFGSLTLSVDGREVKLSLSGWVRKDKNGVPFLSLSGDYDRQEAQRLTIAETASTGTPQPESAGDNPTAADEELPF